MNTRSSFHQSLEKLQTELLHMGAEVGGLIHQAVESLSNLDEGMAKDVIRQDDRIDQLALDIEQYCLNLIALQQPMASDLRLIGMALKIVVDLERMADHAADIADITLRLSGQRLVKPLIDIRLMAELAEEMLRASLMSYTNRDIQQAAALAHQDDRVDRLYSHVHQELIALMGADAGLNKQLVHLVMVAHYLERVADHATNIGEGVIFLVTGKRKDLNI